MQLLGIIDVKVAGLTAPTVRQLQVNEKISGKVHKFANKRRGVSVGQPEYDWSLTCSLEKDKQTLLDLIDSVSVDRVIDSMEFSLGARTIILTDCVTTSRGFSSDSDGTADLTISGIAPDAIER